MKEIQSVELKAILLDMLTDFHKLCSDLGLKYFLTGGTLLGAVRHKGFIPWDDDIDILMPRSDYQRLLETYKPAFEAYSLDVISMHSNDDYIYPFAKLVNNKTIAIENVDSKQKFGVWIDIFPLDNMSDNYEDAVKLFNKTKLYKTILTVKNIQQNRERGLMKIVGLAIGKLFASIIGRHQLLLTLDKICRSYESLQKTKYVSVVSVGTYGIKEIIESDNYQDSVFIEFEGRKFNAPIGYKNILSNLYGDYMKLPPKEKQITHHSFTAYWID